MKKAFILFSICFILTGYNIFAQNNEEDPYLSDTDIVAIETILPEDVSFEYEEEPTFAEVNRTDNEMTRLNTSQSIYHLLILDREYCPDTDITDVGSMRVLYKYKHGHDGYLIALYVSPKDGPVFPQLPARSRVMLDIMTMRPDAIREYINSSVFSRFVTNRTILRQLQEALRGIRN